MALVRLFVVYVVTVVHAFSLCFLGEILLSFLVLRLVYRVRLDKSFSL